MKECLDSILNQSFDNYEVICINDGSTDNTVNILRDYSEKDSRLCFITQANSYAGVARNVGVNSSNGDWIFFLDSDDCIEKNALQHLYDVAISTGSDVVRCCGYYINGNDEKKDVSWSLNKNVVKDGESFNWKDRPQDIFNISAGNPWGMLVKKSLVDNYGIRFFTCPRTEDIGFTYGVYLHADKITTIYDQLVFHRPSGGGMESTKVKFPLVPLEARRELEEKCKHDGFYDSTYQGFWIAGFRSYFQMIRNLEPNDQKDEVKAYYDDIRRVLSNHQDLIFDSDSPLAERASDYFDEYRKLVESEDFESYWSEITRPRREIEERFRKKKEDDLQKRQQSLASRNEFEESILFSVVVPVYNAEEYLRECLDHLINQSYSKLEIICVDDGSSDSSCDIIESEYPSVNLIRQENSGAGIARNNGFSHCTGEYVLFMDSDDWAEYSLFKRVAEVIESNDHPDMVMYSHSRFDQATATFDDHYVSQDLDGVMISNLESDSRFFLNNDFVVPWNKVVKASFIREHDLKYPDFKCSNDRPFYFAALVHAERIAVIDDVLINYRINSKSVTSVSRLDHFQCHYLTYQLVEDDYSKEPGDINEIFTDVTIRDMFHFYDVSNKKYKEIIGRQICEYSDSMKLSSIPDVERYWWYRRIINLKLEFGIPVSNSDLERVASAGDRNIQYVLGEKLVDSDRVAAIGWFMRSADKGRQEAKSRLDELYDGSFDICLKLAHSGNPSAEFRLAKMYRDGNGVDADEEEALKWMRSAADHGHSGATMNLLNMLDKEEAFTLCGELAESGNKDAQYRLARMYIEGKGTEKDVSRALQWMTRAAEQGHQKAKDILEKDPEGSQFYVDGLISEGTLESLNKALEITDDKEKIAKAQYRMALLYRDSKGVPMDLSEARAWMSKAAENGHSEAIRCIGKRSLGIDIKKFVNEGLENRPEEIESECRRLADQGCPDALGYLGKTSIKNSIGDSSEAVKMIRTAFDKGWDDDSALKTLWDAELFEDLETIASELSAKGDGIAMGFLGRMCRDGKGIEKDLPAAAEWMREASNNGNGWADRELLGILWSIRTLEACSEMASLAPELVMNGDVRSAAYLGRMYRDGCGVPQSREVAAYLLDKASEDVGWAGKERDKIGIGNPTLQSLWDAGKHSEVVTIAELFPEDPECKAYKGRAALRGRGTKKDLTESAKCLREASSAVPWASKYLVKALWEQGTEEARSEAVGIARDLAEEGDGYSMNLLGRAYRDGIAVPKDLNKAAEWMRRASAAGIGWADGELLEILWKIDTPESTSEMIYLASRLEKDGNSRAMGILGRSYLYGRGVQKDTFKARKLLEAAFEGGIGWAKAELETLKAQMADLDDGLKEMKTLWKSKRYDELFARSKGLADLGDPRAMGYLARLYRDGNGVEADPEAAEAWMRKSASGGVSWAQNELLDMLWKSKRYDETFALAKEYYEEGNRSAGAPLGRCYRSGKGAEQDLLKAESCLRESIDDGVSWAKAELIELLWTTERYDEMVPLAEEYSETGNHKACGYLGMAYRDGKGVPKDAKKAKDLLTKAASKSKIWNKEIPKGN
ncbi:MAG: glycosyltransferase [Candidatus Methanomethylophilaceae archaeon]|nr:glycosyltransferase [Candidatus Methanomethylophilaceae archaeon]